MPMHDVVGHELAESHVAGGLLAERRAGLIGFAEHVAGGEVRHARDSPSSRSACVPLPAPGGPMKTIRMAVYESVATPT